MGDSLTRVTPVGRTLANASTLTSSRNIMQTNYIYAKHRQILKNLSINNKSFTQSKAFEMKSKGRIVTFRISIAILTSSVTWRRAVLVLLQDRKPD